MSKNTTCKTCIVQVKYYHASRSLSFSLVLFYGKRMYKIFCIILNSCKFKLSIKCRILCEKNEINNTHIFIQFCHLFKSILQHLFELIISFSTCSWFSREIAPGMKQIERKVYIFMLFTPISRSHAVLYRQIWPLGVHFPTRQDEFLFT